MAYEKHTWVDNEDITKERLNAMENGIEEAAQSGGALIVQWDTSASDINSLDKTVQELYEAMRAGIPVYMVYQYGALDSESDWSSTNSLMQLYAIYRYGSNLSNAAYRVSFTTMYGTYYSGSNDYLPRFGIAHFGANSLSEYPTYIRSDAFPVEI